MVLCKEDPGINSKNKAVYCFDLSKQKLSKKPFFEIDISDYKKRKNYLPSGITYNKKKDIFYVIDSNYGSLKTVNNQFEITKYQELDISLLPQVEGICLKRNMIYLASEGKYSGGLMRIPE